MSDSELGRKWDRCLADTVVKIEEEKRKHKEKSLVQSPFLLHGRATPRTL